HRPFADLIYETIAGSRALLVSQPVTSQSAQSQNAAARAVYFMLHGSDLDMSRFWGERPGGGPLEAFRAGLVPNAVSGVVFAGCCWGALTVGTKACDYRVGEPVQPVTPESSIALSFLQAGATAFVGCTGCHYWPQPADGYFGGPMHRAFWTALAAGKAPAVALHDAKREYVGGMPHGLREPIQIAIELKILREFTCLGLGW